MSMSNESGRAKQAAPTPEKKAIELLLEPILEKLLTNTFDVYDAVNKNQRQQIYEVIQEMLRMGVLRRHIEEIVYDAVGRQNGDELQKAIALHKDFYERQSQIPYP